MPRQQRAHAPARARPPLDTTTDVETPEHLRFRHRSAGPARRALAFLVDALVRIGVLLVVGVILVVLGVSAGDAKAAGGLALVAWFGLEWGYFVLLESLWSGRTVGKRALGLRVVKEGGYPIGFLDSFLRNLLRAADFLPAGYALGVLVMARDTRFRRLGDLAAGTMVVVEERARVSSALRIVPPPGARELEPYPARPALSADEVEALELFLRRAGTLSPAREEELAELVAPVFARRFGMRYERAPRFLALLYHRATSSSGAGHDARVFSRDGSVSS